MTTPPSTTKWRDDPVIPASYDDIRELVVLARKARPRLVEFDWAFGPDDLRRLRSAAHSWGSNVRGRYKVFDSRVLRAISAALGETNTPFVLKEPKSTQDMTCTVTGDRDGDVYRLRGVAPFDVVFGYGSGAASEKPEYRNRMGEVVRRTLLESVGQLGWDVALLQERRMTPVKNALNGLSLTYGEEQALPPQGAPLQVQVDFQGPFSVLADHDMRCVFTDELSERSGVYLWTVLVEGVDRACHVGQTRRRFGRRMGEHVAAYLSGQYATPEPGDLATGTRTVAWPSDGEDLDWPSTLPSFLKKYEELAPKLLDLMGRLRFHLAPLEGDANLHNRVEGALGRHFRDHEDSAIHDFFSPGIKLPARIPYDRPLHLGITSEVPILGLVPNLRE